MTSAAPVSALSAMGSAIFPKSVISPRRRAIRPSSTSVTDATRNTTNAAIRQPVPPATRNTTNSGTSTSRSTVSALATFRTPGCGTTAAGAGGAGRAPPPVSAAGWLNAVTRARRPP